MEKTTKKSLWMSAVSLLLCVLMLVGTTFAWFTDSVTSKGNVIQAGNFDVTFEYKDLVQSDAQYTAVPNTALFNDVKWEPGKSFGYDFKVTNAGTLAFDWELSFQNVKGAGGANGVQIADVLDVYVLDVSATAVTGTPILLSKLTDGVVTGGQLTAAAGKEFSVVIKMKEDAGNDYQAANVSFDVVLRAKQATVETDGFGSSDYDKDAEYDAIPVSTKEEFTEALAAGKPVALENNIEVAEPIQVTGDVTVIGNGNALSVPTGKDRVFNVSGTTEPLTITLKDLDVQGPTTGGYTRGISLYDTKNVTLVMDNCTLSANYYAINVASANENVNVVVRNTEITGWAAFQTHSPNSNVVFENCTLKGINDKPYNADGWNDFSTLVINGYSDGNPDPNGAHDSVITLKNCRVEATATTGNEQTFFSVRTINTTINAENCTFVQNGKELSTREEIENNINVYEEAAASFQFNLK